MAEICRIYGLALAGIFVDATFSTSEPSENLVDYVGLGSNVQGERWERYTVPVSNKRIGQKFTSL